MSVTFGKKFTKEAAEAASGGGGAGFIRGFKDGETKVRFLEELEDGHGTGPWTQYREHYDPGAGKNGVSYPCLGDNRVCPGCNSANDRERRAVSRFLVNALTSEGYVNLYRVPQSLIGNILKFSEKYGTITDRDYTVDRSGQGLKTEYMIMPEDKAQVDISAYTEEMTDHETALMDSFTDAWGVGPEEVAEKMRNGVYPSKTGGRDLAEASDSPRGQAPKSDDEDPPWEKEEAQKEAKENDDEEITYSREELLDMSKLGLKKVYKQAEVDYPDDGPYTHEELVDYLIEEMQDA